MSKVQPTSSDNYKIDPTLENGPIDQRECRDLLCFLLFVVHAIGMIFIFIYATTNGNPIYLTGFCAAQKLNETTVSQCSMFCGAGSPNNSAISSDVQNIYKYLYYPAPFNSLDIIQGKGVCVSECPNATLGLDVMDLDSQGRQRCKYDNTFFSNCGQSLSSYASDLVSRSSKNPTLLSQNFNSNFSLSTSGIFLVYESKPFLNRLCVPYSADLLNKSAIQDAINALGNLSKYLYDLYNTYQAILITAGFAFIAAYIYMIFLRFCSGVVIWLMILANIAVLILLGYYFYDKGTLNPPANATDETNKQNTYIGYAIWGLDGAFFLFICCMFNRIRLAIAIIKTATMFVRDVKSAMIVPILFIIKVIFLFAFWIIGFIFIYSLGQPTKNKFGPVAAYQWGNASYSNYSVDSRYILAWWIFAGLWKNAFLQALLQFVIASSVALWYFGQGKVHLPVTRSYIRAFRYHWGSLAFGSLILAIVQFIRLILTYIQNKINEKPELKNNFLVKAVMCLLQCYFWCLEKCIKFLNKNAYIQIAINGKSFCGAAKDAFFIILKNPLRMTAVAGVGGIFIGIGKLIISAAATFAGFLLITKTTKFSENMSSPLVPTTFMFILSWSIALLVMSVYGMAADTILHCFLIDEELNKEKGRDPQFSPEPLRDFLDKAEKKN